MRSYKNKRKRKNNRIKWSDYTLDEQFTIIAMVVAIFFISLHYILAFAGLDAMVELAIVWVGTFLMILVKYSIKSFKGKREEEIVKYKRDKAGLDDFFDDLEE